MTAKGPPEYTPTPGGEHRRRIGRWHVPQVWTMVELIRSSIFVLCELFVLLLLFSPFLVTPDEKGQTVLRPLGARWAVLGFARACWCWQRFLFRADIRAERAIATPNRHGPTFKCPTRIGACPVTR